MTTNAILLVAGVGRRLGSDQPKCLTPVAGRTLLDHQLDALRTVGVRDVTLIVGHDERTIRDATAAHPDLRFRFVRNPAYASSNTLWSLALAADTLCAGSWVVNGDVLFDRRLPAAVARAGHPASIAVDVGPCDHEAVKCRVDRADRVHDLSKQVPLGASLGESVGVARLDAAWGSALATALRERRDAAHRQAYYELAMEAVARHRPLHAARLDAPVVEIDDPADLVYARTHVAPQLEGVRA
jgi:choline kinase